MNLSATNSDEWLFIQSDQLQLCKQERIFGAKWTLLNLYRALPFNRRVMHISPKYNYMIGEQHYSISKKEAILKCSELL